MPLYMDSRYASDLAVRPLARSPTRPTLRLSSLPNSRCIVYTSNSAYEQGHLRAILTPLHRTHKLHLMLNHASPAQSAVAPCKDGAFSMEMVSAQSNECDLDCAACVCTPVWDVVQGRPQH